MKCASLLPREEGYLQSTQDEVSDPDEWADLHYGPASSRSRSRSADQTPVARSMPAILAASRDRRLAIEQAKAMVCHAEEDRERRGVRQVIPSACSSSSRPVPSGDETNFYADSVGISSFFNVGLVPREPAAFENFRWDLIMQGQGPETVVVINSRDLSRHVPTAQIPLNVRKLNVCCETFTGCL